MIILIFKILAALLEDLIPGFLYIENTIIPSGISTPRIKKIR